MQTTVVDIVTVWIAHYGNCLDMSSKVKYVSI